MRTLRVGIVSLALALPLAAHAENRPSLLAEHEPSAPPLTLELEAGWWFDSNEEGTFHGVPIGLGATYRATHLELELDWPFALATISRESADAVTEFASGNPFVAAYYAGSLQHGYFRIGLGIGLPVANIDVHRSVTATVEQYVPLIAAHTARGLWDYWLYSPDRLTFALPLQVESQHGALVVGADAAVAYLISTDDAVELQILADEVISSEKGPIVQAAGLIGGRMEGVTFGTRLQVVWFVDAEAFFKRERAQLAVAPFLQWDVDASGFLYTRGVISLDEPLGILSDQDRSAWGIFLGGGSHL